MLYFEIHETCLTENTYNIFNTNIHLNNFVILAGSNLVIATFEKPISRNIDLINRYYKSHLGAFPKSLDL